MYDCSIFVRTTARGSDLEELFRSVSLHRLIRIDVSNAIEYTPIIYFVSFFFRAAFVSFMKFNDALSNSCGTGLDLIFVVFSSARNRKRHELISRESIYNFFFFSLTHCLYTHTRG